MRACEFFFLILWHVLTFCRYRVDGWSIRTAKTSDTTTGHWKEGDILFEIRFDRVDEVPMSEVAKRPTATEVDDYSEYKRLRKIYRDGRRKMHNMIGQPMRTDSKLIKVAPPVLAHQPQSKTMNVIKTAIQSPESMIQKPTFKRLHFDQPQRQWQEEQVVVSPMTIPDVDHFPLTLNRGSTLVEPVDGHEKTIVSPGPSPHLKAQNQDASSKFSSGRTEMALELERNMKEVAPWTDVEIGLYPPTPNSTLPNTGPAPASQKNPSPQESPQLHTRRRRKSQVIDKDLPSTLSLSPPRIKESRKSIFTRTRSPMAILYDGASAGEDGREKEREDYFGPVLYKPEGISHADSPHLSSEEEDDEQADADITVHPSPEHSGTPDLLGRRHAITQFRDHDGNEQGEVYTEAFSLFSFPRLPLPIPDPLPTPRIDIEEPTPPANQPNAHGDVFAGPALSPLARLSTTLPCTLKRLISYSKPKQATKEVERKESMEKMGQGKEGEGSASGKIVFRNPFCGQESEGKTEGGRNRGSSGGGVAPDVVKRQMGDELEGDE